MNCTTGNVLSENLVHQLLSLYRIQSFKHGTYSIDEILPIAAIN